MVSEPAKPDCFGDIDTVFPLGADGMRVTPDACLRCAHKTRCLRTGMEHGSGLRIREEMIDRAYRGGLIGFFQRWSGKKVIDRVRKKDPSNF